MPDGMMETILSSMKKHKFIIITALITAIVVVAGGIVYGVMSGERQEYTGTNKVSQDVDEILEWKEYRNEYFSFKYPTNWALEDVIQSRGTYGSEVEILLKSPGKDERNRPLMMLSFEIPMTEELFDLSDHLNIDEAEEAKRIKPLYDSLKKEDINSLITKFTEQYPCEPPYNVHKLCIPHQHVPYHNNNFVLNGKSGVLEHDSWPLSSSSMIKMYFISNKKFLKVTLVPSVDILRITRLDSETDILRYIDDKNLSEVIKTIHIK